MRKINFTIFCLMFFAVSFGVAAMAALIPSISAYFGVSQSYAFKLTWLYMLPYGFFALIWAPLTNSVKIKDLFLFTTLGFFISSLFFALSFSIKEAFVFRFLMGVFGCSFVPLVLITIGKVIEPEKKAKYIGTFFALSYLSSFVSVFLSGILFWRIIYLVPTVLSLAAFIMIITHLDEFDFRKPEFKISYLDTLRDKKAIGFFLTIMLASFLYHSLQQRLGVFLHQTYNLRQFIISSIFTISTFSAIIFEFGGGYLSAKVGNIKVVKIGFILMSIFTLLLALTVNYQILFFAVIFWGSGWALTHIGLSSHLAHFPDKILRDASSLNSALRFSFGGLGAFFGGLLSELIGFRVFFIMVGVAVFILGFFVNKIVKKGELWQT